MEEKYFITVDWCKKGKRGIFCTKDGVGFWKKTKHTEEEMFKVLGHFAMILEPKSELFTEKELTRTRRWIPLAEYTHQYGIGVVVE